MKLSRPQEKRGVVGSIFDTLLEAIREESSSGSGRAPPVQASSTDLGAIHHHWHNYDIHKSLKPKLLPDHDFSRAKILLYAFRVNYAKVKKREIKDAKEKAIQHYYADKIQRAARQRAARLLKRKKEGEKEREAERQKKYAAFKLRLLGGIEMTVLDSKTKMQTLCRVCTCRHRPSCSRSFSPFSPLDPFVVAHQTPSRFTWRLRNRSSW
jgi:hypothetical protein